MISIIFPVYNEEGNLLELHKRVDEVVAKVKKEEFELIFIDDCSSDGSPEILKQLRRKDSRVRIVRFARNCGSHAAIAYGLNCAKGDAATYCIPFCIPLACGGEDLCPACVCLPDAGSGQTCYYAGRYVPLGHSLSPGRHF